jgi:hypothetical protein
VPRSSNCKYVRIFYSPSGSNTGIRINIKLISRLFEIVVLEEERIHRIIYGRNGNLSIQLQRNGLQECLSHWIQLLRQLGTLNSRRLKNRYQYRRMMRVSIRGDGLTLVFWWNLLSNGTFDERYPILSRELTQDCAQDIIV